MDSGPKVKKDANAESLTCIVSSYKAEATRATFHERKVRSDIAHDRAEARIPWLAEKDRDGGMGGSAKVSFSRGKK
jgi:hypothetical protein